MPNPTFDINLFRQAAHRINRMIMRTLVLNSPILDDVTGCHVYAKAESLQRTGSFKIRGALNKILSLDAQQLKRGVITYLAGNHGQAVAAGVRMLGLSAVVVMPMTAPAIKIGSCRWWGAEVVLYDPKTQAREMVCSEIIRETGRTFTSPFDDFEVMAGQGTVSLELC